ncbi:hypothetical protein D9613_007295 [Agrocybe pediades]|uniref:Uncharacterized protein n=1 Tax=Agrocybe pediades TaxID=84607 RepID=A0A8H4QH81_9AGAR|nr:hypothetical protein D9613_007295 [Agrocybe pediades]
MNLTGISRFILLSMGGIWAVRGDAVTSDSTESLCSDPPRGQCDFYRDCLEARYNCGPDGYPLGYGEKYCNKFSQSQDRLSAKGQKWMLDTMECLQRTLVPDATGAEGASADCKALEDQAFDSHSVCYLQNGLCSLEPQDFVAIVEIVGVQGLFGSWDSIKEVVQAAEGCL